MGLAVWGTAATAQAELEPMEVPGPNPGAIDGFVYRAADGDGAGLVVAIHGCAQTAQEYHRASGWTDVANELGIVVLYPAQRVVNNFTRCWNWFEPGDTTRGGGEAASIVAMVGELIATEGIDPQKVFVSGVSSGAFMTVSLAASYPDVFSGAAVMAGGPYACARSQLEGISCMQQHDREPDEWVSRLIEGNNFDEPADLQWPQLLVWHGDADPAVNPANARELVDQWTALHGIDGAADDTYAEGVATVVTEYQDADGFPRVVSFITEGMGHGVVIDTATGCGTTETQFYADLGVCSARRSAEFFGLLADAPPMGGETGGETDSGTSGGEAPDAPEPTTGSTSGDEPGRDTEAPSTGQAGTTQSVDADGDQSGSATSTGCTVGGWVPSSTLMLLLLGLVRRRAN